MHIFSLPEMAFWYTKSHLGRFGLHLKFFFYFHAIKSCEPVAPGKLIRVSLVNWLDTRTSAAAEPVNLNVPLMTNILEVIRALSSVYFSARYRGRAQGNPGGTVNRKRLQHDIVVWEEGKHPSDRLRTLK